MYAITSPRRGQGRRGRCRLWWSHVLLRCLTSPNSTAMRSPPRQPGGPQSLAVDAEPRSAASDPSIAARDAAGSANRATRADPRGRRRDPRCHRSVHFVGISKSAYVPATPRCL